MEADAEEEGETEAEALELGDTDPVAMWSIKSQIVLKRAKCVSLAASRTPIWAVSRSALVQAVVLAPGRS